eukprot:Phypoly_transcript_16064.p1 GENE.Phypoly_transcript_16064~~Phypoly_transcript_16064.p1  ORF type:complete len:178 (+),score=5.74 Phypoly_transcript_16064:103-636(+)
MLLNCLPHLPMPIRWLSVFDAEAGKQFFFARQGYNALYTPQNTSSDVWTADKGTLYRMDRWFYKIIFFVNANASNDNPKCTSLPKIVGLFEVTLVGSSGSDSWEIEIAESYERTMFSWKANSVQVGPVPLKLTYTYEVPSMDHGSPPPPPLSLALFQPPLILLPTGLVMGLLLINMI